MVCRERLVESRQRVATEVVRFTGSESGVLCVSLRVTSVRCETRSRQVKVHGVTKSSW